MKKRLRRVMAFLLTAIMLVGSMSLTAFADEPAEGEYLMFLGYGGESESNQWNLCYANEAEITNGIVPTNAMVKAGDTVTIGVTLPTAATYTWWMAPTIVAENVVDLTYTIDSITVDGKEVLDDVDLTITDEKWWYESTGEYSETESIRLMGGYNEWNNDHKHFAESPVDMTEIMFTITVESIVVGELTDSAASSLVPSEESYDAFIALGGDNSAGSWGFEYYGEGTDNSTTGIVATEGQLKNGETTTLSLTFPEPVTYTWFVAPCMIVEDASIISPESTFDVKVFIDDVEVTPDMTAGKSCWAEATGGFDATQCVRIAGGYNEWGDKYLAEAPANFTTITYEITPNILLGAAVTEEETTVEEVAAGSDFDANGTYHAYIGIQSANYSFRNSFDDATYGIESDVFNQVTGWDSSNNAVKREGTITDTVIEGNGTYTVSITGLDFADNSETLNLLFLSTDIPLNDEVAISNVAIKMGGKTVYEFEEAFQDPDDKNYIKPLFINIWNKELTASDEFAYTLTAGMDVEITFEVTGFAYDNAAAVETEAATTIAAPTTQAATDAAADASSSSFPVAAVVGIIIAIVVVAAVVVVVIKKKKN